MSTPEPEKPKILVGRVDGDPADLPEGVVYAPGRDPDAPPRLSRQVEVRDDPGLLAWTRQAYEADLDQRFAVALQQVRCGDPVYLEYRDALEQRAPRAAEQLRRILHDGQAPARGRARAALVLAGLGQPDGEAFLLAALDSPAAGLCAASLDMLGDWQSKVDLARPEMAARIVKLLSSADPDVVRKAVHLCAWRKVPGAEAGLRAALAGGRGPAVELAEVLARLATTMESVQAALPYLFRRRQEKYTCSVSSSFHPVINHPDPAVATPLRQALQQDLLSYEGDEDRLGQHWAGDLASVADHTAAAVLEDIVARAKDPVSRAYALEGLARLQPERAVERILAEVRRYGPWDMLLRLLRKYAVEEDYERICAALFPPSGGGEERRPGLEEARLLLENLGGRGRQRLLDRLDRLEARARQWAVWKLQGLDVRSALAELHSAGVVRQTPDELLARMGEGQGGGGEALDVTEPALLAGALSYADLTTYFDTGTGFVPCNHHHLIRHFARGSGGRFTPEYPVQTWHRQGEDDYDGPYTVQFIYRGRLYRFAAENYGDYYDVDAVVRALNTALEHNGQRERYLGLYTGDQCARFVFADPAAFVPVAQRYGLPLAQDPSEAMRAGRAFEQQVLESLESDPNSGWLSPPGDTLSSGKPGA
jgi:hypothetical protein